MARRRRLISISDSFEVTPAIAFGRCLAALILYVNDNSAPDVYREFPSWAATAQPFIKKHQLTTVVTKIFNDFQRKKLFGEDEAVELGKYIRSKKASFDKDVSIDRPLLAFILTCASNLARPTDSNFGKIVKSITILRSSSLSVVWADDLDNELEVNGVAASKIKSRMQALALKITGKTGVSVIDPVLLQNIYSAGNIAPATQKALEEYSKYASVARKSVKYEIMKFVQASGKHLVSVEDIIRHLDSKNIPHCLPTGYQGLQVDADMHAYTREGRELDRFPMGEIRPNPNYDPASDSTYVFVSIHPKGPRYRTKNFLAGNKIKRFSRVQEFISTEDQVRAKWIKDLSRKGAQEQIEAAMLELMYSCAARVGGIDNESKGEPTYGLTTLLVSHVTVHPDKVILDYVGKKNASQYAVYPIHDAVSKKVAAVIKACQENKPATEYLFTHRGKHINAPQVRYYMKQVGIPISPHDFRRIKGTKLASEVLANAPFKAGKAKQAEVDKWVKKELEVVGAALHHTTGGDKIVSSTAIKSYIDHGLLQNYYEGLGLRVPKFAGGK